MQYNSASMWLHPSPNPIGHVHKASSTAMLGLGRFVMMRLTYNSEFGKHNLSNRVVLAALSCGSCGFVLFCTAIDASMFASTAPTFIMAKTGNGCCSEWPRCLKKYVRSPSAETRLHSTDASALVCSIDYAAVDTCLSENVLRRIPTINVVARSFCVDKDKCVGVCNASLTPAQLTMHLSTFVHDGCVNSFCVAVS